VFESHRSDQSHISVVATYLKASRKFCFMALCATYRWHLGLS
jgi:hypothetical protein